MNEVAKIILRPVSWIYAAMVWVRNRLFDERLLCTHVAPVPTICVGNLAVGGTGKTPHVEYLIRLLQSDYQVAVLSRGYGRKTRGFRLADEHSTASMIGDEPWQIYHKFPNVPVAVCADRVVGVKKLLQVHPQTQVIILDDAFQHRWLRCGLNIILTSYDNLYTSDSYLPVGRLRDNRIQSHRANMVVVTRCPEQMRPIDKRVVDNALKLFAWQELHFSRVVHNPIEPQGRVLVVTGVAHPHYVEEQLARYAQEVKTLSFPDHHRFSKSDIQRIETLAQQVDSVWTTQKDEARLAEMVLSDELRSKIHVLAIRVEIDDKASFDRQVTMYVRENVKHKK